MKLRIGSGHDTHRLVAGRKLILGGVTIPYEKGLDGHSDADIVLHALTDAILGALALGDIGDLFPDTSAENKDRDSAIFLNEAVRLMRSHGYAVNNVDITIFAQVPKMSPYKLAIRESLARLLNTPLEDISIKAKTGEAVGHIGRGEALGCHAVVLLA
jgi:2-C-methyl-D-erythritol 2,4-cyclodiphosphate synthase